MPFMPFMPLGSLEHDQTEAQGAVRLGLMVLSHCEVGPKKTAISITNSRYDITPFIGMK